jgi:hypothetical protein
VYAVIVERVPNCKVVSCFFRRIDGRSRGRRQNKHPKEGNGRDKQNAKVFRNDGKRQTLCRNPHGPVLEQEATDLDVFDILFESNLDIFDGKLVRGKGRLDHVRNGQTEKGSNGQHVRAHLLGDCLPRVVVTEPGGKHDGVKELLRQSRVETSVKDKGHVAGNVDTAAAVGSRGIG